MNAHAPSWPEAEAGTRQGVAGLRRGRDRDQKAPHGARRICANGRSRAADVVVPWLYTRVCSRRSPKVEGTRFGRRVAVPGGLLAFIEPAAAKTSHSLGLEWSEACGAAGRGQVPARAVVRRGSVNAMPFSEGSCFDAVVAADLLCHQAVDPPATLGRIAAGPAAGRPAGRQYARLFVVDVGA